MTKTGEQARGMDIQDAVERLRIIAASEKCRACGCLRHALATIEAAVPSVERTPELAGVLREVRAGLLPVEVDCRGCDPCYPPGVLDALAVEGGACGMDTAIQRPGWPPLAGSYTVLRYHAPVAVCALTDDKLASSLAAQADANISLIGTLQTENLGIERIIQNILANLNIRFLVLCGADSRQAIGHLPGQSLVALSREGIDARGRIVGAQGRRPAILNVPSDGVEHFRRTVEVVDLIGVAELARIQAVVRDCALRNPGPAQPFSIQRTISLLKGSLLEKLVLDPAGYFVIYVDRARSLLALEHYTGEGLLDAVIEGRTAAEVYSPAIERNLLTRLDHAAYLGKELARAEETLASGKPYVQDAAPEISQSPACACEGCR